ncbi:hypothetical protein ACEUZ9_002644 [Paracoccus litorisediminis]|jgi:hypothetical protein|uniref:Uncharacterized protein n=1 Tax=Paracoccus litorisediminis TaxID=2006130 RepID=A0A844HPJ4_9RHOB|nr:hypothetical protein [Paracoccus litorisediminis]MTH60978.1 hypothetical protein [Paracoccus litorisediminis]
MNGHDIHECIWVVPGPEECVAHLAAVERQAKEIDNAKTAGVAAIVTLALMTNSDFTSRLGDQAASAVLSELTRMGACTQRLVGKSF